MEGILAPVIVNGTHLQCEFAPYRIVSGIPVSGDIEDGILLQELKC